jgi:hypothetical protein
MVSFDTNMLVYATVSAPLSKTHRARDLVDAWRTVLPVQGTEDDDLFGGARCGDTGWRSGMQSYGRHRTALNWRAFDSSIRSKQRTIG